jgi:hypothetical protein
MIFRLSAENGERFNELDERDTNVPEEGNPNDASST